MNFKWIAAVFSVGFLTSVAPHSNEIFQGDELEAGTVTIRPLDAPFTEETSPLRISEQQARDLVSGGIAVWEVIQAGKPSTDVESKSAQAIPKGVHSWTQLSGWQGPVGRRFEVEFKNWLGVEAVKMRFRLQYFYEGEYRQKGHYLAGVALIPEAVTSIWGYVVNAKVSVPVILNLGTSGDPTAGVVLQLTWKIDTALSSKTFSRTFLVKGDGQVSDVTTSFLLSL